MFREIIQNLVELKLSNCLIYSSGEIVNAQVGVAVYFCILYLNLLYFV